MGSVHEQHNYVTSCLGDSMCSQCLYLVSHLHEVLCSPHMSPGDTHRVPTAPFLQSCQLSQARTSLTSCWRSWLSNDLAHVNCFRNARRLGICQGKGRHASNQGAQGQWPGLPSVPHGGVLAGSGRLRLLMQTGRAPGRTGLLLRGSFIDGV